MLTLQFNLSTAKDAEIAASILKSASTLLPVDDVFSNALQAAATGPLTATTTATTGEKTLPPSASQQSSADLPERPRRGRPPKFDVKYETVPEPKPKAAEVTVSNDDLDDLMNEGQKAVADDSDDIESLFGNDEPAGNPYASWDRPKLLDAMRTRTKALGADWFRTQLSATKAAKMSDMTDDQLQTVLHQSDSLAK